MPRARSLTRNSAPPSSAPLETDVQRLFRQPSSDFRVAFGQEFAYRAPQRGKKKGPPMGDRQAFSTPRYSGVLRTSTGRRSRECQMNPTASTVQLSVMDCSSHSLRQRVAAQLEGPQAPASRRGRDAVSQAAGPYRLISRIRLGCQTDPGCAPGLAGYDFRRRRASSTSSAIHGRWPFRSSIPSGNPWTVGTELAMSMVILPSARGALVMCRSP
jgi:hypothetical protein